MKIDISKLKTVRNFANSKGQNRSWIYQQIQSGKIKPVIIDGVSFVDTESLENPKVL